MTMRSSLGISCLVILIFMCLWTVSGSQPAGGQEGYFVIQSVPSGSQVIFDGRFIGVTPVTYPVSQTSAIPHIITISANGYYPYTTQYTTNPAPGETTRVYGDLEPSTSTGSLTVISSPAGALITVDGGKGQQAPWTYPDIMSGSHIVQAFLSGYEPYVAIVNVPAGGSTTVNAELKVLSEVGTLQIKSTPGGADVYVDGIFKGATATTVGNLPAGSHFVVLKLAGYQDWSGMTTVDPNQVTIMDLPLHVQSGQKTGYILVGSRPPGASVFLDGIYQGVTQANNPLDLTGISAEEHALNLRLENYQEYSTRVTVEAGKTVMVTAELVQSVTPGSSGTVQFVTEPSGANIFIDNVCQGITPLTVPSLPAGTHTIVLRLSGYRDYQTTLNLTPGQAAQIQASLEPESTAIPLPLWIAPFALLIPAARFARKRKRQ